MTLFVVVFKTFSTFHFQTLWCVGVFSSFFTWFMQILKAIGLSVLPSWEILWHKFLFIVLFLCPLSSISGASMIENVSVFVTVLQVPVARFFSFCVFCSY